ncbi:hypothetical protein LTR50_002375 [Elasticomyces elasticus]|nr:hypothetical protein LTR50_002375 [Elasticomyces elasticus]
MPPKGKHKNANQHDKRHEGGLAAPGKKITRQRSNGNINVNVNTSNNGHASNNGKPVQSATPPPLPSTGLNSHLPFPRLPAATSSTGGATTATDLANSYAEIRTARDSGRTSSTVSLEEVDSADMASVMVEPAAAPASAPRKDEPRRIKSAATQVAGTLSLAATILKSCPLRDVIAILMLLLHLTPSLVMIIQFLFASLTFIPPTSGISLSTLPSLNEMLQATNGGAPSIATVLAVDMIVLVAWLCLGTSLQNLSLDFSQAVIAISLGGAAAGKEGSTNSVTICTIIIGLVHLLRYKAIHLTALDYLRSVSQNLGLGIALPIPMSPSSTPEVLVGHSWPRTLLGIHILTQGAMTMIRKSITHSRETPQVAHRKSDAESTLLGGEPHRNNLGTVESFNEAGNNSSTDGRPPGLPPVPRDSKERVSSSKKKRKQANHVRSQQPLWAAIASTKVTFLKEMEQKHASADAQETIVGSAQVGGVTRSHLGDRVWIVEVGATEIFFNVELVDGQPNAGETTGKELILGSGIDRSKPFYARVNGADWGSTRIKGAANDDDTAYQVWTGEIYGLTPLSNYHCEFRRMSDQSIICSASLITQPAPSAEQVSSPPAIQHQALRPSSPITTLKNSIQSAQEKLAESQRRQKRLRKEHKNANAAFRSELDSLNGRLSSSGSNDQRLKARSLQLQQHIRQAEEASHAAQAEIQRLGEIPENELDDLARTKATWQEACNRRDSSKDTLDAARAGVEREFSAIHSDISAAQQKRERLTARQAKLQEQHDALLGQQHADDRLRERREQQRAVALQQRQVEEHNYTHWTTKLNLQAQDFQQKAGAMHQESEYIESQIRQQSMPATPEGILPNTNGPPSSRLNQVFDHSTFGSPMNANDAMSTMQPGVRGRSSSMLSGVSNFTDDMVAGAHPHCDIGAIGEFERKRSDGSSSGGSHGDPLSPRQGNIMKPPSPIAPPSKSKGRPPPRAIGMNR